VPEQYTVFTRYLSVALVKLDPPTENPDAALTGPTVWQCDAVSPGDSGDLRWVVNYLLVAVFDEFGADTGRQVRVTLGAQDERVRRLAEPTH
jgi:hypothetical protein